MLTATRVPAKADAAAVVAAAAAAIAAWPVAVSPSKATPTVVMVVVTSMNNSAPARMSSVLLAANTILPVVIPWPISAAMPVASTNSLPVLRPLV